MSVHDTKLILCSGYCEHGKFMGECIECAEVCEDCGGSGIDYCDSCYEEGLDGVGHGPCKTCRAVSEDTQ